MCYDYQSESETGRCVVNLSSRVPAIAGLAITLTAITGSADSPPVPQTRILDLMVDVVTPAANMLRAADEMESDADWQRLDEAAQVLARAFETIKVGGTGPNDLQWAAQPAWDADADDVIAIAEAARTAIKQRDHDALFDVAGKLYAPCEACHVAYLPGIDPEANTD